MPSLRRMLEANWYGGSPSWLLRPFSTLFGSAVAIRRWAFRRGILAPGLAGAPVLVIGNVTLGGTGKTPLVIWLVQQLQSEGLRVGVVSRGYGSRHLQRLPRLVQASDTPDQVGDEAVLVARRASCLVCVGVDRLAAARLLVARGCQVIVADDGLQHYWLHRHLEIAVVDGARGMGNGALLPAGPLREPVRRLTEVHAAVVNGETPSLAALPGVPADRCFAMSLQPQQFTQLGTGANAALTDWRGRSVHAVAGIGNPDRYFAMLRTLGLDVTEHAFPDHHRFEPKDLSFGDARHIVMTEKDAVKCSAFASGQMWYLSVATQFKANDATRLMNVVRARMAET